MGRKPHFFILNNTLIACARREFRLNAMDSGYIKGETGNKEGVDIYIMNPWRNTGIRNIRMRTLCADYNILAKAGFLKPFSDNLFTSSPWSGNPVAIDMGCVYEIPTQFNESIELGLCILGIYG
jgi:hypothetical protein